jgi:hypothetical protein
MTKQADSLRSGRLLAVLALAALASPTQGQPSRDSTRPTRAKPAADPLYQGFVAPPPSARPRVWWHWMNGNVTKEGIRLDLEWMKRVGLGGFQNFDAALFGDTVVEKRVAYMTPEWKDAFRYAIELADRLGLETAIAGSPGWSESGGPWVEPRQAMKKLVWSETRVAGGRPLADALPKPPTTTGPFQNVPAGGFEPAGRRELPELYADAAVVACRVPASDVAQEALHPIVSSSGGPIDAALLADGDLVRSVTLPPPPGGEQAWIQFEYEAPQAIRAVTLAMGGTKPPWWAPRPPGSQLEASDDGRSFRVVTAIPRSLADQNTVSFDPVRARFFRVIFPQEPQARFAVGGIELAPPVPPGHAVAELVLHSGARVNGFEEKAAFATLGVLSDVPTPDVAAEDALRRGDVVDLTARMRPDGTLDWTPPDGQWLVLRMGCSLIGRQNAPASPEGTGLEVDKLSAAHVRDYMTKYLDLYGSALGPLMGKRGLQYLISDSWEAGAQNWTDEMLAEFTKRRGYDPHPWLPALTGRVVESAAASERFLWDFRRTLSDLLAENHYDQISALLKARGMGHYSESHESGRAFVGDGMEAKRSADVPMGAMWTQQPGQNAEQHGANADIRESASVAHLYGQNLVAAESMTAGSAPWAWSPSTLKPTADKLLATGLNRFVIHTSVHQPLLDKVPGLSLGPFGQWFTRNETWAEPARAWVSYLARCSYLLQQGRFVADVLYYYGEDTNLTALFGQQAPPVPPGYNYDFVNADALVHLVSVDGGRLATRSGMRYRLLALDPHARQTSLPVLRRIRELVAAGAVVVGAKPAGSPSLADDDAEFQRVADELWGPGPGAGAGEHHLGAGVVHGGAAIGAVLSGLGVAPDFEHTKPRADTSLLFVHRTLADGELYFVDNRSARDEDVEATFRVSGRQAELWRPDTGTREPATFRSAGGRTTVPLHLEPWGTVFVVFRTPSRSAARSVPAVVEAELAPVKGPWRLRFQAGRGAPAAVTVDTLASWSDHADRGVRYFSGSGTYTATIQAPRAWFAPGARLWLDLGRVESIAEVSISGRALGIAWKRPFRVEVTRALKPGPNEIEIKVTNLWVNRMIGDRQPDAPTQFTFTRPVFYEADSPLLPSGLLGPVRIVRQQQAAK